MAEQPQGPRILVIDDDPDIQGFLSAALDGEYALEPAPDGETGLKMARASRPDLILLDIGLPGIDGFEVCLRLKSGGVLSEIPVIMITARDDEAQLERAYEVGAEDFIRKPLSLVEVQVRIRNQLRLHRSEAMVQRQALYDRLTDLPNRRLSFDRLEQALADSGDAGLAAGVLCVDIDDFKGINDAFGYVAGDEVLLQCATRMRGHLEPDDTLGRLGADEFVIVLPRRRSAEEVIAVADRLITAFGEPFSISGMRRRLSVSVGIAVSPHDSDDAGEMLAGSDAALSEAKSHGKASAFRFDPSLKSVAERRLRIAHHLFDAIDGEQFHVCYQPKWNLRRERIDGAEALLRWDSPELGEVAPEEFIGEAERAGQIVRIGEFVLRRACEEFHDVQDASGRPLALAINASVQQVRRPEFSQLVQKVLEQTDFDPARLEIEITENLLLNIGETVNENLRRLREMGVKLAMDDFGTGYSSLSYLSAHPFDVVKIDRLFIVRMMESRQHLGLVRAAISMAHAMDLEVVAEGVEKKEQVAALEALGCDTIQGYWLSPALPVDEFRSLLVREPTAK